MLDRLKKCQVQLAALAERFDPLYANAQPPDLDMLASMRWDIANLAMRHLSMVDRFVLAHLASDERPEVRAMVERFRHDCTARIRDYAEHAKAWPAARVAQDWNGFRRHAAVHIRVLRTTLRETQEVIFPLACPVRSAEPKGLSRNWASEGQAIKQSVIPDRAANAPGTARAGRC